MSVQALWPKIKTPSFIFFSLLAAISIAIAALSYPYFNERIFTLNGSTYKESSAQGNVVIYSSFDGPPVRVTHNGQERLILLGGQEYRIQSYKSGFNNLFNLTYPDGAKFKVDDNFGNIITYDEQGEFVFESMFFVNNNRIMQPGELQYMPSSLVRAAYPEYHDTRGMPGLLLLALAVCILGWSQFKYEKFQELNFKMSMYWVYVRDPEPTDFYYFMSKVGGIVLMGLSVVIVFLAF